MKVNLSRTILIIAAAVVTAAAICSCHHVDNKRLPAMRVNLVFWSQADWVTYGVPGAADYRRFIREERVPSNFPYNETTYTGFGGVLLCNDYFGNPIAYDLACPVECNAKIRVFVNDDMRAECPKCHSTYEIFESAGHPVSGPAARDGYGLQAYWVGPGRTGEFMVVSN